MLIRMSKAKYSSDQESLQVKVILCSCFIIIVEGDCRKGESERKNENIILARGQGMNFSLGL